MSYLNFNLNFYFPFLPGEDTQVSEHVAMLCSACDLSSKSLFVLPYSENLSGYATRSVTNRKNLSTAYCTQYSTHMKSYNIIYTNRNMKRFVYWPFKHWPFVRELREGKLTLGSLSKRRF